MDKKILIIEDNIHHLHRLVTYLKSAHERYALLVTHDGEEACSIARSEHPDLIISDWELKGSALDGIQIISELKKNVDTARIPIIMATQFTSSDMLDKALNAGAVDYIRKPIDKTEILARVRATLLLKTFQREEIIKDKMRKIKVLFLGANPDARNYLRIGSEYDIISSNLKESSKFRDLFELEQRMATRVDSLTQVLLDVRPNIIHFSGHGVTEGIILENHEGKPHLVEAHALESLFELFKDDINCVVLNACYSQQQAEAIAKHIPYAIGMKSAILDEASIAFSLGFYKAIGAGEDINFAYKMGIVNIKMYGVKGEDLPILKTKDT
ncbi:MAG: response regulator [Lewinellaceae bacterium]|nr:response regulator [Lewinellaceae bacterium]